MPGMASTGGTLVAVAEPVVAGIAVLEVVAVGVEVVGVATCI